VASTVHGSFSADSFNLSSTFHESMLLFSTVWLSTQVISAMLGQEDLLVVHTSNIAKKELR
jgi:hypothetical protein